MPRLEIGTPIPICTLKAFRRERGLVANLNSAEQSQFIEVNQSSDNLPRGSCLAARVGLVITSASPGIQQDSPGKIRE